MIMNYSKCNSSEVFEEYIEYMNAIVLEVLKYLLELELFIVKE